MEPVTDTPNNQQLDVIRQHWHSKAKRYQTRANLLFLLFFTLIGLLGYGVTKLFDHIIATLDWTTPQLMLYGLYLLLVTITLWVTKDVLQYAFKNFYLKENAYEKETLILSYLALKEGGTGLEETHHRVEFERTLLKL